MPADAGAAYFWCGMRTMTPDHRFIIGPDPLIPGLFWIAGLEGHGMIASFEVGRIAAELLPGSVTDPETAALLSPSRI